MLQIGEHMAVFILVVIGAGWLLHRFELVLKAYAALVRAKRR